MGKAEGATSPDITDPGHPHGCGESASGYFHAVFISGSSPRVWGKLRPSVILLEFQRVIPTGVGKALSRSRKTSSGPGHPHGCGESVIRCSVAQIPSGSSPRVWGKPHHRFFKRSQSRVIPTGVGKAKPRNRNRKRYAGHPHGCGESAAHLHIVGQHAGSSPRVWGKQFWRR